MVDEELTVHQEEWEVVARPGDDEESSVVQQTIADIIRNGVDSTSSSNSVGGQNAEDDREGQAASPPRSDVANEVDLLLLVVLSPEADTADEERPVDGTSGIRMGSSETSVVGQHEGLEFPELLEEVAWFDLLLLDFDSSATLILASLVADDVFNEPGSSTILRVLVTVNLLLLVCPVGESLGMSPEADLGWDVN